MTDRTRIILVGMLLPAIVGAFGVVLILFSLPVVPDPVAIHWGLTGADGFGPAWLNLVMLVVLVGGYSAFALVIGRGGEGLAPNQRVVIAIAPFLAVLMTTLFAGTLLMQRGLDDAALAPSVVPLLVGGTVGGLVAGVVGWFLLPAARPHDVEGQTPTMKLGASERGVWLRSTGPSGAVFGLVVGTLASVATAGIIALALSAPLGVALAYAALLVVVAALVGGTMFWRLRVTDSGFVARSALGVPRFTVPMQDVASAAVITVNPVRDFGGWGLRWGGAGRWGIVTGAGEALEITRRNGRVLVVTVDGAEKGAALLNTLAAREGARA